MTVGGGTISDVVSGNAITKGTGSTKTGDVIMGGA